MGRLSSPVFLSGFLHHTYHTFHDVINVREITATVAIVENLYGVTFYQLASEEEVTLYELRIENVAFRVLLNNAL